MATLAGARRANAAPTSTEAAAPATVAEQQPVRVIFGALLLVLLLSFLVRPERGGSRVITETRVAGTSPDATRAMLRYWRAIRLGSGAIRRSWLAGIRRRAVRTVNINAGRD